MAKWFKDFPTSLKTGSDRIRSASESGTQSRPKPVLTVGTGSKGSLRKNAGAENGGSGGGGVGSLLHGRNRKNSAIELGRNHSSTGSLKDGKIWEILIPGKSKKHTKMEGFEDHRTLRTTSLADAYMSRMIKVNDPKSSAGGSSPDSERAKSPIRTETIILEDYADPFDAEKTREQREAEREGENDGYMEPYDAQLIITEIRRRGSKDLLKVCVVLNGGESEGSGPPQIYDVPYEEVLEGIPLTRPESDPRPPAEYELPWEWKKEQIVRALSAQFDGIDRMSKEESGSPTVKQQTLRHKSWTPKTLRPNPPSPTSPSSPSTTPDSETPIVDPTLPLEKQSWYHGSVSRQEAESQLQHCREASFLVRDSESATSKYSIALKTSQGCVHIIVAQTKECGYTLEKSSCVFPSIPEVVHHYCTQRLPFTGAEHMTLQHPVPRTH
ncbi:SH2 domain-containing adapter protein E [Sinocyclocheilus rhinocerous]|uniref:SH2 domain-containing adapter protein E n=1 Tax=Sinocyclocheilus rhinocerous TaxID=307959 RepID=A0A673GH51_9TELE|nr:PREDICTED: SH2 domain-containing adapter protein E-like [Sinocyclocheilus rhinocerous]